MRIPEKLILLAIIAVIIPSGFAIKCYICNNLNDGNDCGHGKDVHSKFVKDCDTEGGDDGHHGIKYTLCRKITTWIDFDVNNNTATERIVRKCGYLDSKYTNDCYYRGGFGGRQQVCTCTTDECNSGIFTKANYFVIAIATSLLVFATRF